MENLLQILDPLFIAAILSLTEVIKALIPSTTKVNPRVLTIISTVVVGVAVYFGKDFNFVETLIQSIISLLSASGLYSLAFKPAKDAVLNKE